MRDLCQNTVEEKNTVTEWQSLRKGSGRCEIDREKMVKIYLGQEGAVAAQDPVDGWMDGCMDGWIDGCFTKLCEIQVVGDGVGFVLEKNMQWMHHKGESN